MMTQTFSTLALAIRRAGVRVCLVLLLSGLGFTQEMVTAKATIPFNFWTQDREFQAGDYVFDNALPGSATIHRNGTNSSVAVPVILYAVPDEKENPKVIFQLRDGKYVLVELWSVQDRYVVTGEFQHRGKVSGQQRQVPLTIVDGKNATCIKR